ncbi:hypothetical protein ACFLXE_01680, partial [Chloroflexota bacterium]
YTGITNHKKTIYFRSNPTIDNASPNISPGSVRLSLRRQGDHATIDSTQAFGSPGSVCDVQGLSYLPEPRRER